MINTQQANQNLPQETIPMHLDIRKIRQRVASIKAGWSPETTKARSEEGARRRRHLEDLLLELMCDVDGSEETVDVAQVMERPDFSLVG